ncbi:glutamine--tRNA ligase [Pichia kluyveri]|uniref:glutamine--tRNA ligase n=1 Tax=Pichia kluyveri TaxID=36015 RepID=A0AAV5R1B5_PICKL|nr:glutamine--tRNA ligase [Pichia kluyveri]
MTEEQLCELFSQVGFTDKKIKEIVKNNKVSKSLSEVIKVSGVLENNTTEHDSINALLHHLAALLKGKEVKGIEIVAKAINEEKLKSNLQVAEALKYVENNYKEGEEFNVREFEEASGVGIEITADQVKEIIVNFMEEKKEEIETERYRLIPTLLANVRQLPLLKWASPALFKPIIDAKILEMIGPKDERDVVKKVKKKDDKSGKDNKKGDTKAVKAEEQVRNMFTEGFLGDLHKPGEEPQKWEDVMEKHREFIQGKVYTRFPPEPNGFLHIGHSKAIMVNFGYAKYHDGKCYLRYDDTNPEAEEQVYFDSILRCVNWLGFEPWKITYSSDYFDQLYELAEKMINSGYAYVDHSTAEEVKAQRGVKPDGTPGGERFPSPWRSRSVEENLTEFRKMRNGFYKPGEATLRMKQDISSPSPQMWDLVAYRVLNASHPRTGDKWKIYPTYDFTHCLVDSFENITHSLCTTEFYLSRESYEWLCDVLHVYRPAQREYGRLNITGTIMSKRKIAKLVNEKYVRGWNDPRLYTLESLRRRGIPPGAILSFINTLGVTTSTTNIQVTRFESAVRNYLDQTTPRLMLIENPLKVVLDNVTDDYEELIDMPYKPGNDSFGSRTIPLTKTLYIDASDYRDEPTKGYFRLAPEQNVGLMRVPFNIKVKSVERDSTGKPTLIHAEYLNDPAAHKKPKAYIQWVPESAKFNSPVKVSEVRVYNQLFKSENPSSHPDGFLADINPESEEVIKDAMMEPAFLDVKAKSPLNMPFTDEKFSIKEESGVETVRFQALRVGYFCLDSDSTDDKIILNRIVTLKEDADKN